jgi:hypothetical protein
MLDAADYAYTQDSLSYDSGIETHWWVDDENLVRTGSTPSMAYAKYTDDWDLISDNWSFIKTQFNDRLSAKYSSSLGYCVFEDWHSGYFLTMIRQMGATIAISKMAAQVGDSTTLARANTMLSGMTSARVRLAYAVRTLYDNGTLSTVTIRLGSDGRLNNDDIMEYYNNPNETIPYREYRDRISDIRQVVGGTAPAISNTIPGWATAYAVMVATIRSTGVAEIQRISCFRDRGILNTYITNDPWWWLGDRATARWATASTSTRRRSCRSRSFRPRPMSCRNRRRTAPGTALSYGNSGYRDLFRLQNLVAVFQAMPPATQTVSSISADQGDTLSYRLTVVGTGQALSIASQIPDGTAYVDDSAAASPDIGTLQVSGDELTWDGTLDENAPLDITWDVTVTTDETTRLAAVTTVDNGDDVLTLRSVTIANGYQLRLPFVWQS